MFEKIKDFFIFLDKKYVFIVFIVFSLLLGVGSGHEYIQFKNEKKIEKIMKIKKEQEIKEKKEQELAIKTKESLKEKEADINTLKNVIFNKKDSKETSQKDVVLKDIKSSNLYMKQKENINNKLRLSKNLLTSFKDEEKKVYFKIKRTKNKGYSFYKKYGKNILQNTYPYYDFKRTLLLSKLDIIKYDKVNNYNFEEKEKCVLVFGKKQCKTEKIEYVKVKGKKINTEIFNQIKSLKIKSKDKILLVKSPKSLYYNKFFLINRNYGYYGNDFLKEFSKALKYNNYKFLLLLNENNINSLEDAYKKDILNVYRKLFQEI